MRSTVTGLQHSGIADELNDMFISEVNASAEAKAPYLKEAEDVLSGLNPVKILFAHRSSNTSSVEKRITVISLPREHSVGYR